MNAMNKSVIGAILLLGLAQSVLGAINPLAARLHRLQTFYSRRRLIDINMFKTGQTIKSNKKITKGDGAAVSAGTYGTVGFVSLDTPKWVEVQWKGHKSKHWYAEAEYKTFEIISNDHDVSGDTPKRSSKLFRLNDSNPMHPNKVDDLHREMESGVSSLRTAERSAKRALEVRKRTRTDELRGPCKRYFNAMNAKKYNAKEAAEATRSWMATVEQTHREFTPLVAEELVKAVQRK